MYKNVNLTQGESNGHRRRMIKLHETTDNTIVDAFDKDLCQPYVMWDGILRILFHKK